METRSGIHVFSKPGCSYCAKAKSILDAHGLTWADHDVTASEVAAKTSVYVSGSTQVPQILFGNLWIGGADELEKLDADGDIDALLQASTVTGAFTMPDRDDLAAGTEDLVLRHHIPKSDGTHDEDPETWPILRFYKAFFGFWPNTFAYLHHWPEAYKLFVYCHNFSAIGLGRQILGEGLMFAIAYSTSNAQGCSYCQTHSAAIGGQKSLQAVADAQQAMAGGHDDTDVGHFSPYERLLIGLAARAARNTVTPELRTHIHTLAKADPAGRDADNDIMGTSMVVSAFGFLNIFNDLVGVDVEGDWGDIVKDRVGIDAGRHGAEAGNPDNLGHALPTAGPSIQHMLNAYDARIADLEQYARTEFGIVPAWVRAWPAPLRHRHAYLYGELLGDRPHCMLDAELKHLMVRVAAIAKDHDYLAAVEGFISHHVAKDKARAIQRVRQCYAVASGQQEGHPWFTAAEQAALRVAWLSAQIPLMTPARFVRPAIDQYSPKALVHLCTVCGIASLIQRFVAIYPQEIEGEVADFMRRHALERSALKLRHFVRGPV